LGNAKAAVTTVIAELTVPVISISNKSLAVDEMDDLLATTDMGQKVGDAVLLSILFLGVELGPHLTQCCLGQALSLYQVAS